MFSSDVEAARQFAKRVHQGQTDKAGEPYIGHLTRVAARMETPEQKIVAYLHDSIEDTETTQEDIANLFGAEIAEAVTMMTHAPDKTYMEYVACLKANPLARAVKISDLIDNSNLSRLNSISYKDLERQLKYNRALRFLMG